MIRAISVLEGIALVGNEDFAIIDEAYPYIAQRLLTDDSPRLRECLRYMIYGRSNVFDADRLIDMLNAFETFTVNSRSAVGDLDEQRVPLPLPVPEPEPAPGGAGAILPPGLPLPPLPTPPVGASFAETSFEALTSVLQLPQQLLAQAGGAEVQGSAGAAAAAAPMAPPSSWQTMGADPHNTGSRAALLFLLSDEGAFFRTFLLDEIVRSIDALSRDQLAQLVDRLGLTGVTLPVFLPGAKHNVLQLSGEAGAEDKQQVESVAKLVEFFAGGDVSKLLSENGRGLLPLMPRVAQQVLPEVSTRLASRITARFIRAFYM